MTVVLVMWCWGLLPTSAQGDERVIPGHDVISEAVGSQTAMLERAASDYQRDFGKLPTGDNGEICRQLYGLNPKRKQYAQIFQPLFDDQSNLLDLWLEPYQFVVQGGQMHVFSRIIERDLVKYRPFSRHTHRPKVTKVRRTRSDCYAVALAIRLLVQEQHGLPSPSRLPQLLLRESYIFGHVGEYPPNFVAKQFIDAWDSPLVIKLTNQQVSVSSKHTDYVALEPLTP